MCGHKCAKYTLITFNILFWIAGAVILGFATWALIDQDVVRFIRIVALDNSEELLRAASITLAVVGGVIFVMGFIGCCGAMKESSCILSTYGAIVIILLLAQITAGVLAVIFKDQLLEDLSKAMNVTVVERYGQEGYDLETESYDLLQTQFQCCGVKSPYYEWRSSEWGKQTTQTVPDTCCVLEDKSANPPVPVNPTQCQLDAQNPFLTNSDYFYGTGCYDSMYNWVIDHAAMLMGIAFGLAGLQLFLVILAFVAARTTKSISDYDEVSQ